MIKLEKMSVKQPELDLIAEWRNQTLISLRSNDLTAKGGSQTKWVNGFGSSEKYYFIYTYDINKDGYFIGYCALDKIDPVNRTAEMGLLIRPNCYKQGYGSQAVQELLRMVFTDFNLNCVFIEVIETTSNWMFWQKQGFIKEGVLRARHFKAGHYYPSTIASITKQDWETLLLNEVP